jgi:hypothetical protein
VAVNVKPKKRVRKQNAAAVKRIKPKKIIALWRKENSFLEKGIKNYINVNKIYTLYIFFPMHETRNDIAHYVPNTLLKNHSNYDIPSENSKYKHYFAIVLHKICCIAEKDYLLEWVEWLLKYYIARRFFRFD